MLHTWIMIFVLNDINKSFELYEKNPYSNLYSKMLKIASKFQ